MKERLLGFIFCALMAGIVINWLLDKIHAAFSTSLWFQAHWAIYYIGIPTALLLALALAFGFFRRGMSLVGNLLALLTVAGTVYLLLGAAFSCWKWCF